MRARRTTVGTVTALGLALLVAGCGESRTTAAPSSPSPGVTTITLQPQEGERALVRWTLRGGRLASPDGKVMTLAARPNAAYFSGLAPLATASAGGRYVAYSTGLRARDLHVRVLDTRTGRERALGAGTTGAAWRADGALAYFQGAQRDMRLRGRLLVRRVRSDRMGVAVPWTCAPGKHFPFGWAGGRLVAIWMGEGEYARTYVADAPCRLRLVADGAPIAISPDGARLLAFAGGDGSGRDLVLVDLASGRTVSRLRTEVVRSGDWKRNLVVAAGNHAVVVYRVLGDRITPVTRIPVADRSPREPRFTDTGLRRVAVSTDLAPDGRATAAGICVIATRRCVYAPATTGIDHQTVVYSHSVAAPAR